MMQDFTKAHSKKYQALRILQAPGPWASAYNERIREFGQYRGAIIFPEQLLGLNQKSVFSAGVSRVQNQSVSAAISQHNSWCVYGSAIFTQLNSIDEIYDYEQNHAPNSLMLSAGYNGSSFFNGPAFTSKKSALQYIYAEMLRATNCLG